jgi:DNA repair protein RecN (Recombination protein N)
MLTHIHIRDFTIIDQLELDLENGMTVLTGETGAGKSIIIDALNLALGNRADSGVIRHGCARTDISATFDISNISAAQIWLAEQELDAEDNSGCVLRRTITNEGRSKGYINGSAVPIQSLQALGDTLVDIHGQHEHQSLLKNDMQRQLLDDYAGHASLLTQLATTYRRWKAVGAELDTLRSATQDRDTRLDMLRYQAHELETLALGENEVNALEEERTRLANSGRLLDTCQTALHNLYESDANDIFTVLGRTLSELEQLRTLDGRLSSACDLLNSAHVQIEESANELRHYRDALDLDPERLTWVEQRLDTIHQLARKHRTAPAALATLLTTLQAELSSIEHSDEHLQHLQNQLSALANTYFEQARQLSASRARAAHDFSAKVTDGMQPLGLAGARFDIALQPLNPADHTDVHQLRFADVQGSTSVAGGRMPGATATGLERVEFLVSTNPGQPLKPLSKVASGGELSRISLAIQVIAARSSHIPTLIFDEVDTGIGGGVAETVGRQLRTLGESHQVLCVTHLPQVAALGHHHLHVTKENTRSESTQGTTTRIRALTDTARNEEIARMLGGVEITAQTRAHAREMIGQAKKKKESV